MIKQNKLHFKQNDWGCDLILPIRKKLGSRVFLSDLVVGFIVAISVFYALPLEVSDVYRFSQVSKLFVVLPLPVGAWIYQSDNPTIEFIGSIICRFSLINLGGGAASLLFIMSN